jgi:hypothetical protein
MALAALAYPSREALLQSLPSWVREFPGSGSWAVSTTAHF